MAFQLSRKPLLGVLLLSFVLPFHAATTYVTTFTASTPYPYGVDRAVVTWSTNVSSGSVAATDLINLSIELYTGTTLVYTDNAIVNGAPQPIGGLTRVVTDNSNNHGHLVQLQFLRRNVEAR